MKFKMAPNSLFAVLLRSPWWISVLIALAVGGAAYALLPDPYRPVGAMGGMPFFVVGLVALWQQMQRPSAARSDEIARIAGSMSWPEFSAALEDGFTRQGFRVERLQGVADFSLVRNGRTTLVAARRWKAARPGEEALKALRAAAQARDASDCLYVTLGDLSDNALAFAKRNQVQVMQQPALALLLQRVNLRAG
ncbi:MAG: restriction endonuclease [Ramlibacter sp.]